MNLVVAIFAGLWFWFASGCWGYTFHYVLKQPLVMALPFGILMGDIPTAMIIGATIELVYVGMISPGANIPADECFAGVGNKNANLYDAIVEGTAGWKATLAHYVQLFGGANRV